MDGFALIARADELDHKAAELAFQSELESDPTKAKRLRIRAKAYSKLAADARARYEAWLRRPDERRTNRAAQLSRHMRKSQPITRMGRVIR